MKTASRILGSAAFHAGGAVQDSPMYGAERRGAPIAAFTRMAHETILERGAIPTPDLVVVADDTLLTEPASQPLMGCDSACTLLLNSHHDEDDIRPLASHGDRILISDFTTLCLNLTQNLASLSTTLGVAAACLTGLTAEESLAGLEAELSLAHLSPSQPEASHWKLAAVPPGLASGEVYALLALFCVVSRGGHVAGSGRLSSGGLRCLQGVFALRPRMSDACI